MNRRDFLRVVATSAGGAIATAIITPAAAKSGIIETEAVEAGRIITQEDLVQEAVDLAQFGENLAKIVLEAGGPVTIYPNRPQPDYFTVTGRVMGRIGSFGKGSVFISQDPRYKLVYHPRGEAVYG